MQEITNMRGLRLKHNVTLSELAQAAGVSAQQISRVELFEHPPTQSLERKYESAMEEVIVRRYGAVRALEHDYRAVKGILLGRAEE